MADRTAVITGAARGIGRAIAERLHGAGARVVLADIDGAEAAQVAAGLGPAAIACQVDVTDAGAVQRLVSTTLQQFGGIDALVNNAAITGNSTLPHGGPILDIPVEQWRRVLDVNLTAAFICAKYVGGEMARAGRGSIVKLE